MELEGFFFFFSGKGIPSKRSPHVVGEKAHTTHLARSISPPFFFLLAPYVRYGLLSLIHIAVFCQQWRPISENEI